jgi:hypothetical protein
MLGWFCCVFRQTNGGCVPATRTSRLSSRVAEWQADITGTKWLDQLAAEGKAVSLGGNGYPLRYTVQKRTLSPFLRGGPPGARGQWLREFPDFVTKDWKGKTTIYKDVLADCREDEWLMIEVWDES